MVIKKKRRGNHLTGRFNRSQLPSQEKYMQKEKEKESSLEIKE